MENILHRINQKKKKSFIDIISQEWDKILNIWTSRNKQQLDIY